MVKSGPLTKNAWYKCYNWLISHIPQSVEKSAGNAKQKIMKFSKEKERITNQKSCKCFL